MSEDVTGDQRSDLWFEERLGKATASRFKDIMAGSHLAGWRNYKAELVAERLTGTKAEGWTSKEMQHGIDFEEAAKLAYWLETDNKVTDCGFFKHAFLAAGASPDGLIGEDGVLEIKCPNTATHIETLRTQKVPKQYFWQVQGQMWITGRQWADFVSYDPRLPANSRLFITRVHRDETEIEKLESEVTKFLLEVGNDEQYVKAFKRG